MFKRDMIDKFDNFGYYIMIDINEWRIIRQQCDLRYEFDKMNLIYFTNWASVLTLLIMMTILFI